MRTLTTVLPCAPADCWRALTDARLLTAWLPGLRRTRIVNVDDAGYATEVQFEFSTSLTYSLLYRYDHERREMHWEPRMGKRDAVSGFARVEADEDTGGTRLTYGLKQGAGRSPADAALGEAGRIVEAFTTWMAERTLRR